MGRGALGGRVVVLVAITGALAPATATAATDRGTVVRVTDGDTVTVRVAGAPRRVDLLGLRAPAGRACFAAQARRALQGLLPRGTRVVLRSDGRRRGRGRYVSRGATLVNAAMLERGAARPSRIDGLSRAGTLRRAARRAQDGRRGLVGRCNGPAGTPPPGGGTGGGTGGGPAAGAPGFDPVGTAARVRRALTGVELTDLSSTANTSTRNVTRFCAAGRADCEEEFLAEGVTSNDPFTASWAVLHTELGPDGTLGAEVGVQGDDLERATRTLTLTIAPDGTVRRAGVASQSRTGATCAPAQPRPGHQNDTAAARERLLTALTGRRLTAGGPAATTSFCPGAIGVREEAGGVTVRGVLAVEWAAHRDDQGTLGAVSITGAGGASRRMLVALVNTSPDAVVRDLGRAPDAGTPATIAAAAC